MVQEEGIFLLSIFSLLEKPLEFKMLKTNSLFFSSWLDDFFTIYYYRRPVNATFIGMHDLDHQLPDYSEKGVAGTVDEMQSLLARLDELPAESLSSAERMDRMLAAGYLQTQLWEFQSNHFYRGNPCLYTGEAVFGVISLFLSDYKQAVGDRVNAAIDRMNGIPVLLAQGKSNIRQAPPAWIEQAVDECIGAQSLFNQGIDRLIKDYQDHRYKF